MGYIGKVPADVLIDPHVDSASIVDSTIVTADIANDAVTSAKLAANSVDSSELIDGSVDNSHLAGSIALNKTLLSAGTGLTLSTNTLNVDAAQSGITSVGTLTSLNVSGVTGVGTTSPASATNVLLTVGDTSLGYAGMEIRGGTNAESWRLYSSFDGSNDAIFGLFRVADSSYKLEVHENGNLTLGASNGSAEVRTNRSRMRHIDGLADASDYSHGDLYVNHISTGNIYMQRATTFASTITQNGNYFTIDHSAQNGIKIKGNDTACLYIYDKADDSLSGGLTFSHDAAEFFVYTNGVSSNSEALKIDSSNVATFAGVVNCGSDLHVTNDATITSTARYWQVRSHTDNSKVTKHGYDGLYTTGAQHQYISSAQDIKFYPGGVNKTTIASGGLLTHDGNATFTGQINLRGTKLIGEHGTNNRRLQLQGSGDGYMLFGAYEDNEWGYIENVSLNNGMYFNVSNGAFNFDTGHIRPYTDNEISLGESNARFVNCQLINNPNVTSDKRRKDNIKKSSLGLEFLNKLNPVQYKWKDYETKKRAKPDEEKEFTNEIIKKTYKKTHYGLIAQEVEKVVADSGMTNDDFAPLVYDKETDTYGMMYGEYVGILIKAVQELSAEVEKLKGN